MKKIIALVMIVLFSINLFGCSKKEDADSLNEGIYIERDGNNDFIIKTESDKNNVEMNIFEAFPFKDGYAYMEIGEYESEYYVFINDKFEITGLYPVVDNERLFDYQKGNYYFKSIDEEEGVARVCCVKHDGTRLYNIDFYNGTSSVDYGCSLGEDGTILLSRYTMGYSESCYQLAWVDENGNYKQQFFNINDATWNLKSYRGGISYRGKGLVYIESGEYTALVNMNTKEQHPLNLEWDRYDKSHHFTDWVDNHFYYSGHEGYYKTYKISTDGTVSVVPYVHSVGEGMICTYEDETYYFCDLDFNKIFALDSNVMDDNISSFKNGTASIWLKGSDYRTYSTLIDKKGNYLFEPVYYEKFGVTESHKMYYISDDEGKIINFYDMNGNIISTVDLSIWGYNKTFSLDEIALIVKNDNGFNYVTVDGRLVFENGKVLIDLYDFAV